MKLIDIHGLEDALRAIPDGWFVYSMGEQVKPQIYAGDRHDHIGFYCELQHRNGGKLTKATGITLDAAVNAAVADVEEGLRSERWGK